FTSHFAPLHFHVAPTTTGAMVYPLSSLAQGIGRDLDAVRALLQAEGTLEVSSPLWRDESSFTIHSHPEGVTHEGAVLTWEEFTHVLTSHPTPLVVGSPAPDMGEESVQVRVILANPNGLAPQVSEGIVVWPSTEGE